MLHLLHQLQVDGDTERRIRAKQHHGGVVSVLLN
jgi:hypothetical protein